MYSPDSIRSIQGIHTAAAKLEAHATAIAQGKIDADEMVGLIESRRTFEANAAALNVIDQTVGSLLDILA